MRSPPGARRPHAPGLLLPCRPQPCVRQGHALVVTPQCHSEESRHIGTKNLNRPSQNLYLPPKRACPSQTGSLRGCTHQEQITSYSVYMHITLHSEEPNEASFESGEVRGDDNCMRLPAIVKGNSYRHPSIRRDVKAKRPEFDPTARPCNTLRSRLKPNHAPRQCACNG